MSKFLLTALIQKSTGGLLGVVHRFIFAGIGVTLLNSKEKVVLFHKGFGSILDKINETIDFLSKEGESQTQNFGRVIFNQSFQLKKELTYLP